MKMRNLMVVINEMLEVIPPEEQGLIERLEAQLNSISYAAPELHSFWGRKVAETLNEEIGEPVLDWQIKLGKVFSGEK
jgi:hypothetical protein